MASQFVQIAIFAVIAALIPLSTMLFSALVRRKSMSNKVKTLPYESAEEPVGERIGIMHEYLHYFVAFLGFEIILVVVVIWSTFTRQAQTANGYYIIALLIAGLVFEAFLLAISKSGNE